MAVAALRWHKEHFPSSSALVFTTDGESPIWKRNFSQRVLDPLLEMAEPPTCPCSERAGHSL